MQLYQNFVPIPWLLSSTSSSESGLLGEKSGLFVFLESQSLLSKELVGASLSLTKAQFLVDT